MHGVLISWSGEFGTIRVRKENGVNEMFFLHACQVDFSEDEIPHIGDRVIFDVSTLPVKPGRNRRADHAKIYRAEPAPAAAIAALSGRPEPPAETATPGSNGGAL